MAPDPSLAGDQSVNAGQAMPDVATESRTRIGGTLDKVGMTQIEVPVRLRDDDGVLFLCPAKADAFVSLDDAKARGIHMSRLFLALQEVLAVEELNLTVIKRLLAQFVGSHAGISRSAFIHLTFDLPVKRRALVSDNASSVSVWVSLRPTPAPVRVRLRSRAN
jgi:GTP cyclohydrolase I